MAALDTDAVPEPNFKALILKIALNLSTDDLDSLKYMFKDLLPRNKMNDAVSMFKLLEEGRLIQQGNTSLLTQAFLRIGRNDLLQHLQGSDQEDLARDQEKGFPDGTVSDFRLVLFEIAQNLEPDEVEQAKYYFGDKIGNQKREKIKNAFHLLTILEQLMPNSITEELKRFLTHIGRNDILQDNKASAGAYEMPRIPIQVVRQNSGYAPAAPKSGGAAPQASDTKKATSKDLFPGSLGKSNQGIDIEKVCDLDLISRAAASVCSIDTYGTGFRVGDKCIMTAAHVLKDALEIQEGVMQQIWDMDSGERSSFFKCCVQNKLNLTVLRARFTHWRDCYYKLTTLRYVDINLDTAVVELAPSTDGNPFPQAFTRFRGDYKGTFNLIGHVGHRELYREHNCYTITERKDFQRMKIELGNKGIPPKHLEVYDTFGKDSSFLQFHCSLRHGASGSPGVVVHDGEVRVVTMLQAGYPGNPSNINIDDRLCVEQGVTMAAIYEHMGMTDKQLHEDIFGPD